MFVFLVLAPVALAWRLVFSLAGLPLADWAWTVVYLLAVLAHVVLAFAALAGSDA